MENVYKSLNINAVIVAVYGFVIIINRIIFCIYNKVYFIYVHRLIREMKIFC